MLNPLSLPAEVVAALRSVVNIERVLADGFRSLDESIERLDGRLVDLPDRIELRLRDHFERQQEEVARLHPELVANREHAERLPGKIDRLDERVTQARDAIGGVSDGLDALRAELRELLVEVSQVRETVEPLQGPAERVGRLSDRLPGGG